MPIYEYVCEKCHHELEALQKISDSPLTECPACHESALRKKVSAAAFRLKGGGWYETDFKSGDKKKNLVSGDAGASGGADKSAGKTPDKGADSAPKTSSSASKPSSSSTSA